MSNASATRRFPLARWLGPFALALWIAAACNNGYTSASIGDGDAVCGELVQYCAAPASALGEPYQSCYETGMRADPDACLGAEDRCVRSCYDENALLQAAAGAAGAPGSAGSSAGENAEAGGGNVAGAAGDASFAPGGAGGVSTR